MQIKKEVTNKMKITNSKKIKKSMKNKKLEIKKFEILYAMIIIFRSSYILKIK